MKEYYCLSICERLQDTEDKLNRLAKEGWILVCSYAWHGNYLIMERELSENKKGLIEKSKVLELIKDDSLYQHEVIDKINKLKIFENEL